MADLENPAPAGELKTSESVDLDAIVDDMEAQIDGRQGDQMEEVKLPEGQNALRRQESLNVGGVEL